MHKTSVPRRAVVQAATARDWRPWLLLVGLLLATLAAYQPAWHGGLVWDDDAHITAPALRSWTGLSRIWFDVRATLQYYPLLHSAFWIEHRLWGDATLWYHLINILEHVGVALMLALILRRLTVPGAYLAAAVFALHPVHVESVAWIAEQKNTLSALFYMAAAMLYLRFDESRRTRWYAAAMAAFVLALLSKTVTATLPGALLVVFWWRRGRLSWTRDALPLVPFVIVGAGAATITTWWELAVNDCTGPDFQFTFVERLLMAGRAIWFQLGKLYWPVDLAFIYPRWTIDSAAWWQYLFPLGAAALAGVLWAIRGWSRAPLAAFLFFCGTLFPVLGFFNLYTFRYAFVANHYQYLASVGPIALTVAWLKTLTDRVPLAAVRYALIGALVVVLGVVSRAESRKFGSLEALLQDTISKDPRSWFALTNLGSLRLTEGRLDDARRCFEEALRLKPGFAEAHNNLGNVLFREGDLENALRNHQEAVRLKPGYAEAHNNLGIDLANSGRLTEAMASYRRALEIDPRYALAHFNLANALVRIGDAAGAEQHYREAIALDPDLGPAHYALGLHLLWAGRDREARDALDTAFRLKPDFAQGYFEVGNVQLQRGQVSDAVTSYSRALSIRPDYAEAHGNLGSALMRQDRMDEAIVEFREALRLKPGYAIAVNNLGFALERQGRTDEAAACYADALRIDPAFAKARENLDRLRAAGRAR